eukprot:gene1222-32563_t
MSVLNNQTRGQRQFPSNTIAPVPKYPSCPQPESLPPMIKSSVTKRSQASKRLLENEVSLEVADSLKETTRPPHFLASPDSPAPPPIGSSPISRVRMPNMHPVNPRSPWKISLLRKPVSPPDWIPRQKDTCSATPVSPAIVSVASIPGSNRSLPLCQGPEEKRPMNPVPPPPAKTGGAPPIHLPPYDKRPKLGSFALNLAPEIEPRPSLGGAELIVAHLPSHLSSPKPRPLSQSSMSPMRLTEEFSEQGTINSNPNTVFSDYSGMSTMMTGEHQRRKHMRRMHKVLERQGVHRWLTMFLSRTIIMSFSILLIHTGCFVAIIVLLGNLKTCVNDLNSVGQASMSMNQAVSLAQALDLVLQNVSIPDLYPAPDCGLPVARALDLVLQNVSIPGMYAPGDEAGLALTLGYWTDNFDAAHRHAFLDHKGSSKAWVALWEMPNLQVEVVDAFKPMWVSHMQNYSLWQLGCEAVVSLRDIQVVGIAANGCNDQANQLGRVALALLVLEACAMFMIACAYIIYLLSNVNSHRHAMFSMFLCIPRPVVRTMAAKQSTIAVNSDTSSDSERDSEQEFVLGPASSVSKDQSCFSTGTSIGRLRDLPVSFDTETLRNAVGFSAWGLDKSFRGPTSPPGLLTLANKARAYGGSATNAPHHTSPRSSPVKIMGYSAHQSLAQSARQSISLSGAPTSQPMHPAVQALNPAARAQAPLEKLLRSVSFQRTQGREEEEKLGSLSYQYPSQSPDDVPVAVQISGFGRASGADSVSAPIDKRFHSLREGALAHLNAQIGQKTFPPNEGTVREASRPGSVSKANPQRRENRTRVLITDLFASWWLLAPFLMWAILIISLYAHELPVVHAAHMQPECMPHAAFFAQEMMAAAQQYDPYLNLSELKHHLEVSITLVRMDYAAMLYGDGPAVQQERERLAAMGVLFNSETMRNLLFFSRACLRTFLYPTEPPCSGPDALTYSITHNGVDNMVFNYLQSGDRWAHSDENLLTPKSPLMPVMWQVGLYDAQDGVLTIASTQSDSVMSSLSSVQAVQIVLFLMSVVLSLVFVLAMVRPFVKKARLEAVQVAKMLGELPTNMELDKKLEMAITTGSIMYRRKSAFRSGW